MGITRRDLLRGGAAAGALLFAPAFKRSGVLSPLNQTEELAATRASKLYPGERRTLVHADLHNHTLMSDGVGDPAAAFASMRHHGLDVAALTDHATISQHLPESVCETLFPTQAPTDSPRHDCQSVAGIDESSWARAAVLADTANARDDFVAIRGFEWSSPTLGHMNVWFSEDWTDPLHTAGGGSGEGAGQFLHDEFRYDGHQIPEEVTDIINQVASEHGANAGMRLFYEWLTADPTRPGHGGGADGIAGFNHPGREVGRFGYFAYDPAVADRVVSLELFNRDEDYLFEGTTSGVASPLVQCLDAGWRVGLLGVTDEHGDDWGGHTDKGRGGLWVTDLSRDGVKEAMQARRFFATNTIGLRLDAAATGSARQRARMGQTFPHRGGDVTFELDIDRGDAWIGKELHVQVLVSGPHLPDIAAAVDVRVPAPQADALRIRASIDPADTSWAVLRVTDPQRPADDRAQGDYASAGGAIAYASPFYLDPEHA
ncbi:MAG: hypothetical protein R3320_05770 [Nitriliruptorales bacterium]|nr:hypothetical protein [Nitriliruptorales bacterium]